MREQVSKLISKMGIKMGSQDGRRGGRKFPGLAAKVARFAGESTGGALWLTSACTRVGLGARAIGGRPIVNNEGRIEIGRSVRVNSRWVPVELSSGPRGALTIGDDVGINFGTLIRADERVTIGDRVMIGNYCIIADTEVPGAPSEGQAAPRAIEIGDGAWLAVRVTVLPGAKIGAGTVITAGSVVSGEIPPGVVAGGIPARVLRGAGATHDAKTKGEGAPAATNGKVAHADVPAPKPRAIAFRGTVISDFTVAELSNQLARVADAPGVEADVAPYGQVMQLLMQGAPPQSNDFAVVWTRPESVIPSFGRLAAFEQVSTEQLLAEVDQYCELVAKGCSGYRFAFVPTWSTPAWDRGMGLLDTREGGVARGLAAMNLRLMDQLAKSPNVHVLDAQRWIVQAGRNATPPKSWYLGKVPFHTEVFAEAARDIHAALRAVSGQARKLLVLDLDDTMWGGIVGDVGWENLRLGGHDGLGEAFVDFQRGVKNLTRRGVVLAVVSKNEEATALEAIRKHPEMVVREDDLVGWRINWRDKAQNILELAKELNLGLQSIVFLDDNPVERARVREALPEVLVPEWPEDKHLYRSALSALRCFDTPSISKEDAERTQLYAAERKREQLQANVGSMDEWLKSLGMKVRVEPVAAHNVQRTVQLLNKTNQMNLTTRRLTEPELMAWAESKGRRLWAVTVSDRFGDAGLTGIVSVEIDGAKASIVDFVLSCRVMGRKVENTMVHVAVEYARQLGASVIEASFIETAKNKPCLSFWQGSGFRAETASRFAWTVGDTYALPEGIALDWQR